MVAHPDVQFFDAVAGAGQRLAQRGLLERDALGDFVQMRVVDPNILGKRAVHADAAYARIAAQVHLGARALGAGIAVLNGVSKHPVARREQAQRVRDFAHFGHLAGELVAQDQRALAVRGVQRTLAVIVSRVAAADTAGAHLYQHLMRPDPRDRHRFQPHDARLVENLRRHLSLHTPASLTNVIFRLLCASTASTETTTIKVSPLTTSCQLA